MLLYRSGLAYKQNQGLKITPYKKHSIFGIYGEIENNIYLSTALHNIERADTGMGYTTG